MSLLGPDGTPIRTASKDAIPKELHGFKVTLGMGPYPYGAEHSHRRAVYAELTPEDPKTRKMMRNAGKEKILGIVPITPEAATELRLAPAGQSKLAEELCTKALEQAILLARKVEGAIDRRAVSVRSPGFPGGAGNAPA